MTVRAKGSAAGSESGQKPRLGVSTCLLGESVRYDGAEKRDPVLLEAFGDYVEWVPVCPEVECGMTVPRDPMHLADDPDSPRLVTTSTGEDQTERMQTWIRPRLEELAGRSLWGFVLKSNSPSCGRDAVVVTDLTGARVGETTGLFAAAVAERFPLLPVADERALRNDATWDNFIERLFCLKRYRDAMRPKGRRESLLAFHAAHELQLMAHDRGALREMGELVAHSNELPLGKLSGRYEKLLMRTMELVATPAQNAVVLLHALGRFDRDLSPDEKQEALEIIEECRGGRVPLALPVELLRRHIRSRNVEHLSAQSYFRPHPLELNLRNHA